MKLREIARADGANHESHPDTESALETAEEARQQENMNEPLKVGLVGAGVFAGYHADKIAAHERVTFTGLHDHRADRAGCVSKRHSIPIFENLETLCEASDAMIIAIPATRHFDVAMTALDRGAHVLIEKPMTPHVEASETLTRRAAQQGRIIQVGHQERVVIEALGLTSVMERPIRIEAKRLTGRSERNKDVSVILDLMSHDIDLIQWILGAEPDAVRSTNRSVYTDHIDISEAHLCFDAGERGKTEVHLAASRDATPERTMTLTYPSGTVSIDFLTKTLTNNTPFNLDADFGGRPDVRDSLATAFDIFVGACLDGTPPLVSGQDGLAAVRTAVAIEQGRLQ